MDYNSRLELSFYQEISTINEEHKIYIVKHIETNRIFVKKVLSVYNISVYQRLKEKPVTGIPKIFCIYEENNQLIIIEEYIPGNTLSDMISDGCPLLEEQVTVYTLKLCDILESLHSLNPPVIHRDIKPSNIMITPDNQVVLIDFNAARLDLLKEEDTVLLGTKGYAAPEQYGFGSSSVQTDIYAVGMLINTMLKGKLSRDISTNVHYHRIIECCIKINPQDRFESIKDLKQAVRQSRNLPMPPIVGFNWNNLIPPGFRTKTVWHMIIAVPVYAFIIILCTRLEVKDTYGMALWFERLMCLIMFFSLIACTTNYLNIWRFMPLCSNKNFFVRLFGVAVLAVCVLVVLMTILIYVELVVFK